MTESHQTDFICPGCQARYKVVRVKAEAGRPHRPVQCLVCKKPLAATDGENILKYFLPTGPRTQKRVEKRAPPKRGC